MASRMTWSEIKKNYPDQWVGLTDVDWENEATVASAVVSYPRLTKNEALRLAIQSKGMITARTTKETPIWVGVVG